MNAPIPSSLIGIGIYTPAEAGRLTGVQPAKIARWLRGHRMKDRYYAPLWSPQIDLDDGHVYLGFRDLTEIRVADAMITAGLSPQAVRKAIGLAKEMFGLTQPLSTRSFRTDGRTVFVQSIESLPDGRERGHLLDLFKGQYGFKKIIEPSLKNLEFEDDVPVRWWPGGKDRRIVIDPERSFGQPIDSDTGVPTSVLLAAFRAEGSDENVARVYDVPLSSVRRAVAFEERHRN